MEHRQGVRRQIQASVVLRQRMGATLVGNVSDVSISGMFVATEGGVLSTNSVIDVELTLPGTAMLRTYRWQAMVIRKTPAGVGLMFDRIRPPAVMALLNKVQTAPEFPALVLAAPEPQPLSAVSYIRNGRTAAVNP